MSGLIKKISLFLLYFFFLSASGAGFQRQVAERQIKNLQTFTRLYGYVKYFYPGDEAASLDWDRFAIYGVKQVEKSATQNELKHTLEVLFHPIAPTLVIHESAKKHSFSVSTITPPDTINMKLISWQHLGVGLGNNSPSSHYKSIRLNRRDKGKEEDLFGAISSYLESPYYKGKTLKLKVALRVKEGEGYLFLRIDQHGGKTDFLDYQVARPTKLGQWNYYEIEAKVGDDAIGIAYGCFLRGDGQLWLDDFHLYEKSDDSSNWKSVNIKNPSFETDKEDGSPSGWECVNKGYFFKVSSSFSSEGKKSLEITRKSWQKDNYDLFLEKPAFGEHISKELGSGLSCVMPLTLYGTQNQTYPKSSETELARLKEAMSKQLPIELSANQIYVRLGALVICWNVFQHFYPYFDVVKIDWQVELTKAFKSAYQDKTETDFQKTLQKFTAGLKDGHLIVNPPRPLPLLTVNSIDWDLIENQLVITDVDNLEVLNILPGDIVTEIDGKPVKYLIEDKGQYISAATKGGFKLRLLEQLKLGHLGTNMKLTIQRDGKTIEATLTRSSGTYLKKSKPKREKIEDGIFYLNMDRINMGEIMKVMAELEKAKAIVCDMRGYPSKSGLFICHLLREDDKSDSWLRIPRVIYPDYQKVTYSCYGWKLRPRKPYLKAKMVFIINERAISFAESILGFVDHYKLGIMVGQPSAGTNGNVNSIRLPGGYSIYWTGMKVVKHDGSQLHGVGFIPDIMVKRTIKGVKQRKDELLEKAIEIAQKSK